MSEPRHRKLAAMGMANLVSTGRHEVLERLRSEICNLWLDVLCEIREAKVAEEEGYAIHLHCVYFDCGLSGRLTSGPEILYLYWDKPPEAFYRATEGMPEYTRREAVRVLSCTDTCSHAHLIGAQSYQNDPARVTQLTTYIQACLAEAEAAVGGTAVLQEQYLAKADPTVLAQIQAELMGQKIQRQ